jgi:hypothetical protein
MAKLFSLFGEIVIDNNDSRKKINETIKTAKSASSSFKEQFGKVAKSAVKIGSAVVGTGSAIVGSLTAMANKSADTADQFDKASLRTGINVEELQRLKYAAGQSGIELGSLEKSAKKMNERLSEVATGNKKSSEMFEKLGVSVRDSNGNMRSSTDIYNDVLNKLADMGDTAETTALGTELFGKAFVDMKPLLAEGSDGIKALKNNADKLGIVMSEKSVKAGVKFGDTMADIKSSIGGILNNINGALFPVIQEVLDLVIKNLPTIQSLFTGLAPVLGGLLKGLLPPLIELAKKIFPILLKLFNKIMPFISKLIEAILPIIIKLLEMLLPPILQIVEMVLPILLKLIEPLLPLLKPIFDLLSPFIELFVELLKPLIDLINLILPPLITLLKVILELILPPLQLAFSVIAGVIKASLGGAFEYIRNQVQVVMNIFNNIIDFIKNVFTGNWKDAWENVKNIFKNIAQGLGNIFKAPINFIIDIINGFIKGLNKIKIPDWVPGVGGKGINIGLIKKLRVGMDYVPYDEMPAILHKGERVLTSDENKEFIKRQKEPKEEKQVIYNNNINIEKLEVRKDDDIEQIAKELFFLMKKEVDV